MAYHGDGHGAVEQVLGHILLIRMATDERNIGVFILTN